jgi:hypothetical protein
MKCANKWCGAILDIPNVKELKESGQLRPDVGTFVTRCFQAHISLTFSVLEQLNMLPPKERVGRLAMVLISVSTDDLYEAINASMNQLQKVEDDEGPAQAKRRRSSIISAPTLKVYSVNVIADFMTRL